jgi:hypothetical protein
VTAVDVTGGLAGCDHTTAAAVKSVLLVDVVKAGQEGVPTDIIVIP